MPLLPTFPLHLDADAVLRGQGADPAILRARRPALVNLAQQALDEALPLVEQSAIVHEFDVEGVRHERLLLAGGQSLRGKLIAQHLGQARKLYVLLCTLGGSLEQFAEEMMSESPVYALAIDGVGSAAVEALANAACRHLEDQAAALGWKSSIPLSPGMIDWPVDEGQPQIFKLLEAAQTPGEPDLPARLSSSYMMMPRKSLTMVVGAGPQIEMTGRTCDFCNLRDVCRYQDHYN